MKARMKHLGYLSLAFVLGGLCTFLVVRGLRPKVVNNVANPPVLVKLTETNLPIVLINTNGLCNQMTQQKDIAAQMCIIHNGEGQLNYADTAAHREQRMEFNGFTDIHIRRTNSSMLDKKSYSLRLQHGKCPLFGWKKSNKWYLLAEHRDGSLMRNALTYELARPYFDYVPHVRHCELVIDGVYQGVYLIAEKVSRERLEINKANHNDATCSGGILIKKSKIETFKSKYPARDSIGYAIGSEGLSFEVDYPNNLTPQQLSYIQTDFSRMEDAINSGLYSEYSKRINVMSFVSYQLLQEFTNNPNGFVASQKIYKSCGDNTYSMTIWGFDVGYGNITHDGWSANALRYKSKSEQGERPFWWETLAKDTVYYRIMTNRWAQLREESFSAANIENKIDSLQQLLTVNHAAERNSQAWNITDEMNLLTTPHPFDKSVEYLRNWIVCRLDYLDSEFLGTDRNPAKCDSACLDLGRVIMYKK